MTAQNKVIAYQHQSYFLSCVMLTRASRRLVKTHAGSSLSLCYPIAPQNPMPLKHTASNNERAISLEISCITWRTKYILYIFCHDTRKLSQHVDTQTL